MHRHSPYAESHLYFRKMSSKLSVWLTIRVMDGRISPYNSGCIEAVLARALQLLSQKAFSPVQIKETRGAARKWKTCLDARNLLKLLVRLKTGNDLNLQHRLQEMFFFGTSVAVWSLQQSFIFYEHPSRVISDLVARTWCCVWQWFSLIIKQYASRSSGRVPQIITMKPT